MFSYNTTIQFFQRMCHVCGKMRKRVWVMVGDIVLVSLRDFQDAKGDIILKYNSDEAKNLKVFLH